MALARISSRVPSLHEGTAAGGDDLGRAIDQPGDHSPLAVAEMRLAEALEDVGHGHAGGGLDLVIGIDEGQAHALRQAPADRRFARTHQPDQHDRLPRPPGIHCLHL
jgi:hypothetical protein